MESEDTRDREHAPVVACVPNFSEGQDRVLIRALAETMATVAGARVMHVDPGASANRTVVTLAGSPAAVVEAAFRGVSFAVRHLDLRAHRGVHPRLGVADVVPFVPLQGVTLADCAALAQGFGARVGRELGVPVYLYGASASSPERASLARIRRGQAEALPIKLGRLPPDFGPATYSPAVARTGATVVGARDVLVAWNVTLDEDREDLARAIAALVREGGVEGMPGVRAIGWSIKEYGRAQVSTNLLDWRRTSPAALTAAVTRLAGGMGVGVAGSELVGMIPEAALLADGGPSSGDRDADLRAAATSLGLDHLGPIDLWARLLDQQAPGLVDPLR